VRISSEKQTLILAGESIPRRDLARAGSPLTPVATRADDAGPSTRTGLSWFNQNTAVHSAFNAANAYARTQDLSALSARMPIIDTYA
jgi:hypothetical protein